MQPTFSIIVPVYNRPIEASDLLQSLDAQTNKDFEVVIVEDGSSEDCKHVVSNYEDRLTIRYYYKENSGPGDSRNFGMAKADGKYLIFFDSDCIIPPHYFKTVAETLKSRPLDAYGGPDAAHDSFSPVQKAINYAMTSFITTGGIRGKKNALDVYQPRSFNMGMSKEVYDTVGGYSDIHPGEDPDLSYRILKAGFKVGLIEEAYVYHKRRIDFGKFKKQVSKFATVRPILIKWYPDKFKLTYLLPSVFFIGTCLLILASLVFWTPIFIAPLGLLAVLLFIDALIQTKSLSIAGMAVYASFTQLLVYGYHFIKSAWHILIQKRDERVVFKEFFFDERGK